MSFGWPVAASQAGRIYLTLGFRAAALIGSVLAVAGGLLLLTVDGHSSIYHLALPGLVLGLGFGLVVSPGVVASQSSVAWSSRGVATGANLFARSVGSAVGVAVFGAVVNGVVASRLHGRAPRLDRLAPAILEPALHTAFVVAAAVTVILLVVAVAMPKRVTAPAPETVTHQ
jgi:MFS family permease